jgi:hypothetical protein
MTQQSLILLDVDGVLLHPVGYKEALRAAVNHFGRLMGLTEPVGPSNEDIAVFEASGMTNEWDSVSMCVSLLILAALDEAPHLARERVPDALVAIREAGVQFTRPDYTELAREVAARGDHSPRPSEWTLKILLERAPEITHDVLKELLDNIYSLTAPTTRVFQHFTLGNERFTATYGEAPDFESESLLATLDRSLLNEPMRQRLLAASANGSHRAVIFTARPSALPSDAPEGGQVPPLELAPEADIAHELLALEALPLIATGRMAWLAARNGAHAQDYVKPSPVQALASMGAALSGSEAPALEAALAFVEHGEVSGPLSGLKGKSTRVHVLEDSVNGIRAVGRAADLLREAGLDVTVEGVGISPEAVKQESLARVALRVVDDVNEGLRPILAD